MDKIELDIQKAIGQQEISDLNDLIVKPGWKIYRNLLDRLFAEQYVKLRKGWKNTEEYSHMCGILDGLEKAMNIVEEEIAEYEQQPN